MGKQERLEEAEGRLGRARSHWTELTAVERDLVEAVMGVLLAMREEDAARELDKDSADDADGESDTPARDPETGQFIADDEPESEE